jgi:hypothetical protein
LYRIECFGRIDTANQVKPTPRYKMKLRRDKDKKTGSVLGHEVSADGELLELDEDMTVDNRDPFLELVLESEAELEREEHSACMGRRYRSNAPHWISTSITWTLRTMPPAFGPATLPSGRPGTMRERPRPFRGQHRSRLALDPVLAYCRKNVDSRPPVSRRVALRHLFDYWCVEEALGTRRGAVCPNGDGFDQPTVMS